MRTHQPARTVFSAATKGKTLELYCYGAIGAGYFSEGFTAADVANAIKEAGTFSAIALRINSPGGDAFEGIAIYNLLRSQKKNITVSVDGLAASAASIIAMAGDRIEIGSNAMIMIHNAWSLAAGDAKELRAQADILEKASTSIAQTYTERTGKTLEDITAMMDAETWLSAEDSLEHGFADALQEQSDAGAQSRTRHNLKAFKFKNTPAALQSESDEECNCTCPACEKGDCPDCTEPNCDDPGCSCEAQNTTATPKSGDKGDKSPETAPAGAAAATPSNLSNYEARTRLLKKV
jgi:ATP-dependent Clp endopeptidase proteolytic subunit ClpP